MATLSSPALIRWLLISSSIFIAASELSLVSPGPTSLQLHPSLLVENSPGSKPVTKVKCERIQIYGFPRLKNLNKFARSMKVNISFVNPHGRVPNVEVYFHRNASLGVGMCPQGQWERLTKEMLVKSMSPFDHKILDIRMAESYAEDLQVSLYEGVYAYRIWFLILAILLLTLAPWISKSLIFYYSGAMAIGIFLVMLIVLFQAGSIIYDPFKYDVSILHLLYHLKNKVVHLYLVHRIRLVQSLTSMEVFFIATNNFLMPFVGYGASSNWQEKFARDISFLVHCWIWIFSS